MATSSNFAIEKSKADRAIEWMNSYAIKSNKKFETKLEGYTLNTKKFGIFEVVFWRGEWSAARDIIRRVSAKLNMKVVEGGYYEKSSTILRIFGTNKEFAKVYSGGNLIGSIVMISKSGKWLAKSENMI